MTSCSSCDDRKRVEDSTRKKSFQIILPSDVDIALASVYCLRATESVLRREQPSCQLPPLRAEGSKKQVGALSKCDDAILRNFKEWRSSPGFTLVEIYFGEIIFVLLKGKIKLDDT